MHVGVDSATSVPVGFPSTRDNLCVHPATVQGLLLESLNSTVATP